MQDFIKIHPSDTVAVALKPLSAGDTIQAGENALLLKEEIPKGHKFALTDIPEGAPVIKYGEPIGIAAEEIPAGSHVHIHNLKTALKGTLEYQYKPEQTKDMTSCLREKEEGSRQTGQFGSSYFGGYRRENGRVGVRNEIWILPTVGCVNQTASAIAKRAQQFLEGSIDAIAAFPHPYGCSQMGEDQENTRKLLAALACHPNAGGVLVLGLGCENSGAESLKEYMGAYDPERVKFLIAQNCADEIEEGVRLVEELCREAKKDKRERISCSELVIGLKCGGSDGLSGITANPSVGRFSDRLIRQGGTTILTEVPEMFGAEALLMNRCESKEVFEKTVQLINGFKEYFISCGQSVSENPSPGNKEGGISTLEDKALGCTQKSGSALIKDVLAYGEPVKRRGLNLLNAPGNDLVASTALAASGAHMVLFTTGRGTPFACPVPTVKISSNTALYEQKKNWIDFDCGRAVQGKTPEELGEELLLLVCEIASGKRVKSEEAGFHDMAIWKQGVTL